MKALSRSLTCSILALLVTSTAVMAQQRTSCTSTPAYGESVNTSCYTFPDPNTQQPINVDFGALSRGRRQAEQDNMREQMHRQQMELQQQQMELQRLQFLEQQRRMEQQAMQARIEQQSLQTSTVPVARAEFDRMAAENKRRGAAFLAQNLTKPGVQTHSSDGIQYRVIENGNGAKPTTNSMISMHFRGSLPTEQEFASTYVSNQPATMTVSELPLLGLRKILPMMSQGSRWEVFLPPDQAYGDNPRGPVGPGQVVVFDVKLIEVR